MKVANSEIAVARENGPFDEVKSEETGIVIPVFLWWLGVPVTLLVLLWLFGIL
jgi:hypothetical protein